MRSQSSSLPAGLPVGVSCSRSSSDIRRKRSSSSMAGTSTIETEHPGELQRGLALLAVFDECDQRDGITALVAAREIGPPSGSQIDLERAQVAVAATRVEREIFVTRPSAVGKQAATDGLERGERLGVDAVEVDGAATKH